MVRFLTVCLCNRKIFSIILDHFVQNAIVPKGLLIFTFKEKEFCLDIKFLTTILSVKENQSFELVSRGRRHLVRHNNGLYPLINLTGPPTAEESDEMVNRIILVDYKEFKFAFPAEMISEIIYQVPANDKRPESMTTRESTAFSTEVIVEGRKIHFLDLDGVASTFPFSDKT